MTRVSLRYAIGMLLLFILLVPGAVFAGGEEGSGASVVGFKPARVNNEGINIVPLAIENASPIAGVQFEFSFDPEYVTIQAPTTTERTAGMQVAFNVKDDIALVILYDLGGSTIKPGSGEILNFPVFLHDKAGSDSRIKFEKVLLADKDAKPINVTFDADFAVVGGVKPDAFLLGQNYPNPFNPETLIKYQLPELTAVRLTVFNLRGQEVRTLVNEAQEAGFYEVTWNGTDSAGLNAASGVYFARISAGTYSRQIKMVLLR